MSQIEELQGRIASALDRISQGLDLQANTQVSVDELTALQQALDAERDAVMQLEERNKTLNDKITSLEGEVSTLSAQVAAASAVEMPDLMTQFGASIADARTANETVRVSNEKLRAANSANVSEPHMINSGMMAELDSLKAMRALDQAELTAILEMLEAALGPDAVAQGGV